MPDKELELEVRRWLEFVLKNGTYDNGAMIALKKLYYKGREDVKDELKATLGIENCNCN